MNIAEYVAGQSAGLFEDLPERLRIPPVSADPARHEDVRLSAQCIADYPRGAVAAGPLLDELAGDSPAIDQ